MVLSCENWQEGIIGIIASRIKDKYHKPAFIISINEFIMALFLGTVDTETLPRIIYPVLRYRLTPLVAAASGVLMLMTVVVLLVAARIVNLGKLVQNQRS